MALMLRFGREWGAVGMVVVLVISRVSSDKAIFFPLKFSKRKKEKKESRHISGGFKRSQVFLKKYYPIVLPEWNRHC
jgi:hypothetical protein